MTNQVGLDIHETDRVSVWENYEYIGNGTVLGFRTSTYNGKDVRETIVYMDNGYIEYVAMDYNDHNNTFIERIIK